MKWITLSACVGALFLFSGCLFESYRPVMEYDLPAGEAVTTSGDLSVMEFRNDSTAGVRLQFREASGQVVRDPYHFWALPPGQLVSLALNRALTPEGAGGVRYLTGTLDVFEVDAVKNVFQFAGSWGELDRERFRFDFSVPVKDRSAEETARAAGVALRQLAERIGEWSRTTPETPGK